MATRNTKSNPPTAKVELKTVGEWAFRLLSLIIVPMLLWMITLLLTLDKDVSVMKSNRLSAADGYELRQYIDNIEVEIRKDMPPEEWKARIIEMEDCIVKLQLNQLCF